MHYASNLPTSQVSPDYKWQYWQEAHTLQRWGSSLVSRLLSLSFYFSLPLKCLQSLPLGFTLNPSIFWAVALLWTIQSTYGIDLGPQCLVIS